MDPTVSQAPWWYVAALAGGFTVLGGVITLAGGWLSDRRKSNTEHRTRHEQQVRELCAEYIRSLSDIYYLVSPYNTGTTPPTPDQVRKAKAEAYQASTVTQLLVDQDIIIAGKAFYVSTCDYVDQALAHGLHDDGAKLLEATYKETRIDYLNSVRKSLGKPHIVRT